MKQPAGSNDPCVGRVSITSIPPPHTASSIMRCIFKIEMVHSYEECQLFPSLSNASPLGVEHVSLFGNDGPGSTPEDAMAVVVSDIFTAYMRVTKGSSQPTFESRRTVMLTCFNRQGQL